MTTGEEIGHIGWSMHTCRSWRSSSKLEKSRTGNSRIGSSEPHTP